MDKNEIDNYHAERFETFSKVAKNHNVVALLNKLKKEGCDPSNEDESLAALSKTVAPNFCKAVYRYYQTLIK